MCFKPQVLIPHTRGDLVEQIHSSGEVLSVDYQEEGVKVWARVPPLVAGRVEEFSLRPVEGAEGGGAARRRRKRQATRRRDVWMEEEVEGGAEAGAVLEIGAKS